MLLCVLLCVLLRVLLWVLTGSVRPRGVASLSERHSQTACDDGANQGPTDSFPGHLVPTRHIGAAVARRLDLVFRRGYEPGELFQQIRRLAPQRRQPLGPGAGLRARGLANERIQFRYIYFGDSHSRGARLLLLLLLLLLLQLSLRQSSKGRTSRSRTSVHDWEHGLGDLRFACHECFAFFPVQGCLDLGLACAHVFGLLHLSTHARESDEALRAYGHSVTKPSS